MPRGAIPTARSELAASEPYLPEGDREVFVPTGQMPSPNNELASARPYKASGPVPERMIRWPLRIETWEIEGFNKSSWAEEAFAKACGEPKVYVPVDAVSAASRQCGLSNFAAFMRAHGFEVGSRRYSDGPFYSVDWTNATSLNSAIATVGPVKIGVASASLAKNSGGGITPGSNGWSIHSLPTGGAEDQCASLCGFGQLAALVDLFAEHGVDVTSHATMPSGLCYAMYVWGSLGIIDRASLMNITGEAWVRNPTTVVGSL